MYIIVCLFCLLKILQGESAYVTLQWHYSSKHCQLGDLQNVFCASLVLQVGLLGKQRAGVLIY